MGRKESNQTNKQNPTPYQSKIAPPPHHTHTHTQELDKFQKYNAI